MEINSKGYLKGQYMDPEGKIIPSGNITMKGVDPKIKSIIGISDKGEIKNMKPGMNYYYPNANYIVEYPIFKKRNGGDNMNIDSNSFLERKRSKFINAINDLVQNSDQRTNTIYQTGSETHNVYLKNGKKYSYTDSDKVDKVFLRPYYVLTSDNGDTINMDADFIENDLQNSDDKALLYSHYPVNFFPSRSGYIYGRNGINNWFRYTLSDPLRNGYAVDVISKEDPKNLIKDPNYEHLKAYYGDNPYNRVIASLPKWNSEKIEEDTHYYKPNSSLFYVQNKDGNINDIGLNYKEFGEDYNSRNFIFPNRQVAEKNVSLGTPMSNWKGQRIVPLKNFFPYNSNDIQTYATENVIVIPEKSDSNKKVQIPFTLETPIIYNQNEQPQEIENVITQTDIQPTNNPVVKNPKERKRNVNKSKDVAIKEEKKPLMFHVSKGRRLPQQQSGGSIFPISSEKKLPLFEFENKKKGTKTEIGMRNFDRNIDIANAFSRGFRYLTEDPIDLQTNNNAENMFLPYTENLGPGYTTNSGLLNFYYEDPHEYDTYID